MKISSIGLKNFLIIKQAQLDLSDGFNVVTGETGSGKSLFVSAVKFLKGARGGKNLIGCWGKRAEISAVINIEDKDVYILNFLDYLSIEPDENKIIVRRIIGSKNICYINQIPVNKSVLEKLLNNYIEISSQFENQEFFNKNYQISIIDKLYVDKSMLKEYKAGYLKLNEIQKEIELLKSKDDFSKRDYLEFQIREIEELKIANNEEIELAEQVRILENRNKILLNSEQLEQILDEVSNLLSNAENHASELNKIIDLKNEYDRISSVLIEVKDLYMSVSEIKNCIDEDIDVDYIQGRFNSINSLFMKHNVANSDDIFEILSKMKNELKKLDNIPKRIIKLEKEYKELNNRLLKTANDIFKQRNKSIPDLEKKIIYYLLKLGMDGVKFKINHNKISKFNEFGNSEVEFLVNTVGSSKMVPIKNLSGGELSRLLLSVKLISNESGKFILFDEIDSNIGGETASIASEELKKSAHNNQLLVITHFPQTASAGECHIVIEKEVGTKNIHSNLKILTPKQRISELARMMGNSELKENLVAAEKMLS